MRVCTRTNHLAYVALVVGAEVVDDAFVEAKLEERLQQQVACDVLVMRFAK